MGYRPWVAALLALAAACFALAGPGSSEAHHLCSSTGSPLGPYNHLAYEAANYRTTYSRAIELAATNRLFPEHNSFAVPRLGTGSRSAGMSQLTDPYVPPTLLKAIAWLESGWSQADWTVPYGGLGPTLISHDCGYGIMQITTGMQNVSNVPTLDQAMISGHFGFNIARGATMLGDKWNDAPASRPIVGTRNPKIIEDWYYTIWSYNGFAFKNHPLNPSYSSTRPRYSCGPAGDGFGHDRTQYPYQELVLGCMERPPVVSGSNLWSPQKTHLPDLSSPAFRDPLSVDNWQPCSFQLQCAAMDLPRPNPNNQDGAAVTSLTRSDVIGQPSISVSRNSATLRPLITPSLPVTVSNTGSGVLAYRATTNASWLKVSRSQGVALGTDLGGTSSTFQIFADPGNLPGGTYTGRVTIESRYASGAPRIIEVVLENWAEGALLRASGTSPVYVVQRGLRRHVPDPQTFEAMGFDWAEVKDISQAELSAIPLGQPLLTVRGDGFLLTASGSGVFVMQNGARRQITSQSVFDSCGYGSDAVFQISQSRLNALPAGTPLSGHPCPRFQPVTGTLLSGNGPEVFIVQRDLKRHIPNRVTFEARGLLWGNINRLPESMLNSVTTGRPLPSALGNGNLLVGTSSVEVYVMDFGKKRHVTSPSVLLACGYSGEAVQRIPLSQINAIPTGEPLNGPPCPRLFLAPGTLINSSGSAVYVMQDGLRRHIPDRATFEARGFRWGDVNTIPASQMNHIPQGVALLSALNDGNILTSGNGEYHAVHNGARRTITSAGFGNCGFDPSAAYSVPASLLQGIPAGDTLSGPPCPQFRPPNGSLIRGEGFDVYVMQGGFKHHIVNREAFIACGYRWGNIDHLPAALVDKIPTGTQITGTSCP